MLDIGCNGGFYAMEMKRRGAERVVGDRLRRPDYLAQARFAAEVTGSRSSSAQLSVYDVAQLGERFDLVLFMGVLYHLRHPLLALDLIHEHVAGDLLVFQSHAARQRRGRAPLAEDYPFWDARAVRRAGLSRSSTSSSSATPATRTNWWIPNRACVEAMLRSAGFDIVGHPEDEVYVCRRREVTPGPTGRARSTRRRRGGA